MDSKKEIKQKPEERYPLTEYKKQTFLFSRDEVVRLLSLDTVIQTAIVSQKSAENLINTIINTVCLPRVAVKNSPDIGVEYDLASGNFYVYLPKFLCSMCHVRKVTYSKPGSTTEGYCDTCQSLVNKVQKKEEIKK